MICLINKSIQKWYHIQNGGRDWGNINCALCKAYYHNNCADCPIKKHTKLLWCTGTPYEKWHNHQKTEHDNLVYKVSCDVCNDIVNEEIEFLLLIKEEVKNVHIP